MRRALGLVHSPTPDTRPKLYQHFADTTVPVPVVDYQALLRGRLSALGNDRYGCCVPAGLMHATQVRMAAMLGSLWDPTTEETLALYGSLTGFDVSTGLPDRGTDVDSALAYASRQGLSLDLPLLDMLHPVSLTTDAKEQSLATEWFGWVGYSLALPLAAQDMKDRFDIPACGLTGEEGRPGGWGAHFVVSAAYDMSSASVMRRCISWGEDMEITQAFIDAYFLRADSGWSNDAMDASGHSFAGLDRDGLSRDSAMLDHIC